MNCILLVITVSMFTLCVVSLPVTRMRVCVQSSDPTRLQSQCVYCNNRYFVATVRHCTANTYLPATLSVEEAFCLVKICRRQLPNMKPEPFYSPNESPLQPNADNNGLNDVDYAESEALYAEGQSSSPPNGPVQAVHAVQASKKRPPASFSVGKPQRPLVRPLLFGKRSVGTTFDEPFNRQNISVSVNLKSDN